MPESTTTQVEQQQRLEVKLRRELGDTILTLLNNDAAEDIVLNPDGALWAKQMGSGFRRVGQMSASQAVCAMNTIASMRSMVLNYERPVLETELPIDGSRFEGLIPPVVRHPVFAIRRRPRKIFTLDQYCDAGILTNRADPLNRLRRRENFADQLAGLSRADVIRAAIAARKNILTAGSTGSGKTTFTNAILDGIAEISPQDRVISIEDTTELQCSVANYVDLRAVGSVTMLDCLRACMRLKPSRIVVGEVRGAVNAASLSEKVMSSEAKAQIVKIIEPGAIRPLRSGVRDAVSGACGYRPYSIRYQSDRAITRSVSTRQEANMHLLDALGRLETAERSFQRKCRSNCRESQKIDLNPRLVPPQC